MEVGRCSFPWRDHRGLAEVVDLSVLLVCHSSTSFASPPSMANFLKLETAPNDRDIRGSHYMGTHRLACGMLHSYV
jgi:hypothetical protein